MIKLIPIILTTSQDKGQEYLQEYKHIQHPKSKNTNVWHLIKDYQIYKEIGKHTIIRRIINQSKLTQNWHRC